MGGARASYCCQFKLQVVCYAQKNGIRAAGREFDVDEKNVRRWIGMKDALEKTSKSRQSFRGKKAKYPDVETNLLEYVKKLRADGFSVSMEMLQFEARQLSESMGIPPSEFKASYGWARRFMARNDPVIRSQLLFSQEAATDMSTENDYKDDSLWLGIDLGTTSVKAALTNIYGYVIESTSGSTGAEVKSEVGSSGYEQDPLQILKTVHDLVLPLMAEHMDRIRGIGITGQMHGVLMWRQVSCQCPVSLDKIDDLCCSNLYTWQDQRCTPEFLETLPRPSSSDQPLATGHGCVTIFWLTRNQPTFFKDDRFTCFGTIMDLLVAILCGLDHPATSDQLAASLGYFKKCDLSWDSALYDDIDFPDHLLPKIVQAGTCAGHVISSLKGWPSGVPVFVGMGDVQCAMFATLKDSSEAAVNISTSIQLGFIIPADATDTVRHESPPSISFFPYFDGRQLALCAGLNGGNAISHFVESIANWVTEIGFTENVDVFSLMNKLQKLAEESSSESSLTVRPVFFGERHDTDLHGQISGISAANFSSIGTVFKAVCEGVVDHLHDMVPSKYLMSRRISRLLVSGSVPMNNPIVKQRLIKLYTLGLDLGVLIDNESLNAVGSAVGAARVIGKNVK